MNTAKFQIGIIAALLLTSFSARAEFSAITVAANIKSYDEKSVLLRVSDRNVRVPRSLIQERRLVLGGAVLLTLHGREIEYLLPKVAAEFTDHRGPASAPLAH